MLVNRRRHVAYGPWFLAMFALCASAGVQQAIAESHADTPSVEETRVRFSGRIDGSEVIEISQTHAWWNHRNWDWPSEPVTLGGVAWNPRQQRYLENRGETKFLPAEVDFENARLENVESRDTVTLETGPRSVRVSIADTPKGAGIYEFDLVFPHQIPKRALDFRAEIDGSDVLILTREGAQWKHRHWGWPKNIVVNGIFWDPQTAPTFPHPLLPVPEGLDFTAARMRVHRGRDVVVMQTTPDMLVISFADNPDGAAVYDLAIEWPASATRQRRADEEPDISDGK